MMASNVRWYIIRTKEEYVHSKNEAYIIATDTSPGPMNRAYDTPPICLMNVPSP